VRVPRFRKVTREEELKKEDSSSPPLPSRERVGVRGRRFLR